jgi:hypothetical protein
MTIPVNGWKWGYFMPIGGDGQGNIGHLKVGKMD